MKFMPKLKTIEWDASRFNPEYGMVYNTKMTCYCGGNMPDYTTRTTEMTCHSCQAKVRKSAEYEVPEEYRGLDLVCSAAALAEFEVYKQIVYKAIVMDEGSSMLVGETGSGKSTVAGAVCHLLRTTGFPALFVVLATLRVTYENYQELLKTLLDTPFLFLDDFGQEDKGPLTRQFMNALVESLYNTRKKRGVVLTTNLQEGTKNSISGQYGARVYSRFNSIFGEPIVIDGDKRVKQ